MTDPTHDPQAELDELASAHLDGQTSAEEASRVTGDPALVARVEQLRQARAAVRTPDLPPDPGRREAAIAAALLAAGHEPLTAPVPQVDDLAVVRARRSSARRWLPLAGVAAAIALAALLIPRLGDDAGPSDTLASRSDAVEQGAGDRDGASDDGRAADSSATAEAGATLEAPADPGADTGGGAADAGAGTDGEPGATTTGGGSGTTTTAPESFTTLATPAGHLLDLGTFADGEAEQLVAAAKAAAADPADTPSAKPTVDRSAVDRCLSPMEATADEEGATVLYAAVAKVGAAEVVGIAIERDDGGRQLRIEYLDGCAPWFEADLDEPDPTG